MQRILQNLPVKFSASVKDFDSEKYFDRKDQKKMDTFMQYGMAAGIDAVTDSKLLDCDFDANRVGVSIGSGIGGLPNIENTRDTFKKSGARRISPFFVPASIINMISGNLSIKYGFKGPNLSIVTACTTGTHNIGEGFRQIQYSHADVMVCGGAEMATSDLGVGGFAAARALSTRNDSPETASRPWDKDRDGFVLGDGAGVLVLEELEHAINSLKSNDLDFEYQIEIYQDTLKKVTELNTIMKELTQKVKHAEISTNES